MPRRLVSIIVGTRDRAESLRETLRAIGETRMPGDLAAEVLVVDNGSSDRTRSVVRQARLWGQAPRYLFEPRLGKANANNAGIAAAQGEVLLWTDDDVRPGPLWIEAMCGPLLRGEADAVAGRVRLPDDLERTWLQPWHRVCLAVDAPATDRFNLVGANMAFVRRTLEKVPSFDPELGPGALGFCEDTLFSLQSRAAGLRLVDGGEDSAAMHHCGEARLTRRALMDVMMRQGRSQAYLDYHWNHRVAWFPLLRGWKSLLALAGVRAVERWLGDRPIGRREARWLWRSAYYDQMRIEARRPRQYERFGLRKAISTLPFDAVWAPLASAQRKRA